MEHEQEQGHSLVGGPLDGAVTHQDDEELLFTTVQFHSYVLGQDGKYHYQKTFNEGEIVEMDEEGDDDGE